MALSLSNAALHFELDLASSSWSLHPRAAEAPAILGARLGGAFRLPGLNWRGLGGLRPWRWLGRMDDADLARRDEDSRHGPLQTAIVRPGSGHDPLAIAVHFSLPRDRPFLLIRIGVQNRGDRALGVSWLRPLCAGPEHRAGAVRLGQPGASVPPTFFSNGWQSWSFAGTLTASRRQPHTNLGLLQGPPNHNPATPVSGVPGRFSGDMFGVLADPARRAAIVAGFLAQRLQFGSVAAAADPQDPSLCLAAHCDDVVVQPGGELWTDPAYVQLLPEYDLDPLGDYAEAVARENDARVPGRTPVGWCSWYHYFDRVTEADVRSNLDQARANRARLPLPLIQVDDGFEADVGDWFEANAKFPSGLRSLAASIRADGFTPGLWLAPFIAKPESSLARERPEWILRDRRGRPASAGYVFNRFCRGLDPTHPGVQEHTQRLIHTAVNDWGYPYLKLDFLYAAALPALRHEPGRTRAQALRLGLELIREAAGPEAFLLGCGCPLGPAVGLVDAMRIGPDVDVRWRPSVWGFSAPVRGEPAMPSTRNAIRNAVARAPLHRRWWLNDPDCLLARATTRLTLDEVKALATVIALSGGLFLVSDDLASLTPDRRRLIEPLLPVLGKSALARDWLEAEMPELLELPLRGPAGEWTAFGLFNWGEAAADRTLPVAGDSHIYDFWTQTYYRTASALRLAGVPPHGGRLLAVRRALPGPQFVGSSLHFSQGGEVEEWDGTGRGLRFVINLERVADGHVVLALPSPPVSCAVTGLAGESAGPARTHAPDDQPMQVVRLASGVYRLPIHVGYRAQTKVEW